jgi:hypothetical protein
VGALGLEIEMGALLGIPLEIDAIGYGIMFVNMNDYESHM